MVRCVAFYACIPCSWLLDSTSSCDVELPQAALVLAIKRAVAPHNSCVAYWTKMWREYTAAATAPLRSHPMASCTPLEATGAVLAALFCVMLTYRTRFFCGYRFGQLGLGHMSHSVIFQHVAALAEKGVEDIACGYFHTIVLTRDWSVYVMGGNEDCQLGLGDTQHRSRPVLHPELSGTQNRNTIAAFMQCSHLSDLCLRVIVRYAGLGCGSCSAQCAPRRGWWLPHDRCDRRG